MPIVTAKYVTIARTQNTRENAVCEKKIWSHLPHLNLLC